MLEIAVRLYSVHYWRSHRDGIIHLCSASCTICNRRCGEREVIIDILYYLCTIYLFFSFATSPRPAVFDDKRGRRIITRFTAGAGRNSNFVGFRGNRWRKNIYKCTHNIIYYNVHYNRNGKYATACTEYDYYNTYYRGCTGLVTIVHNIIYNINIYMHNSHPTPSPPPKRKKKIRPFIINRRRVGNSIKSTRLARPIMPFFRKPDDRCDFNNLQGERPETL